MTRVGGVTICALDCFWNQCNTYKYTQSHTHLTLNHITSKQFWLAEHVNRKRKTPGCVSFPSSFFLLFHLQLAYVYEIPNGGG